MAMFRAETPYGVIELTPLALIPEQAVQAALWAPVPERVWVLIESIASPAALDVLDALPPSELGTVISLWEKQDGLKIGDLLQVATVLQDHREPVEADLIDKGLRLRQCPTPEFNWQDLKVILRHLPVTSKTIAAMFPDRAGWTREALLLAEQVDSLHWLQWAQTKDGRKGRNRPKPIPRPGVVEEQQRPGAKPKPAPLSVIKQRMADRYAKARRHTTTEPERAQKIHDLFGRR